MSYEQFCTGYRKNLEPVQNNSVFSTIKKLRTGRHDGCTPQTITRDLQKVSALFTLKLHFIDDYQNNIYKGALKSFRISSVADYHTHT
jgi:hypothetical protein